MDGQTDIDSRTCTLAKPVLNINRRWNLRKNEGERESEWEWMILLPSLHGLTPRQLTQVCPEDGQLLRLQRCWWRGCDLQVSVSPPCPSPSIQLNISLSLIINIAYLCWSICLLRPPPRLARPGFAHSISLFTFLAVPSFRIHCMSMFAHQDNDKDNKLCDADHMQI